MMNTTLRKYCTKGAIRAKVSLHGFSVSRKGHTPPPVWLSIRAICSGASGFANTIQPSSPPRGAGPTRRLISETGVSIRTSRSNSRHRRLSLRDGLGAGRVGVWWAMTGSNRRHSRCKRDALPTELIAPAIAIPGGMRCTVRGACQNSGALARFEKRRRFRASYPCRPLKRCPAPPAASPRNRPASRRSPCRTGP
jgi:hypothetical protein